MISGFSEYYRILVVAGFCAQFTYVFWLTFCPRQITRIAGNIRRLNEYGRLDSSKHVQKDLSENTCLPKKETRAEKNCTSRGYYPLSEAGYLILLGTLKKVEQKNSSLVAILAFFISAFLATSFSVDEWTDKTRFFAFIASMLISPLLGAAFGIRQVDARSSRIYVRNRVAKNLPKSMARDLLFDLMFKESAFRFSLPITTMCIAATLIVLVLDAG